MYRTVLDWQQISENVFEKAFSYILRPTTHNYCHSAQLCYLKPVDVKFQSRMLLTASVSE
jgi:hypothetical protein